MFVFLGVRMPFTLWGSEDNSQGVFSPRDQAWQQAPSPLRRLVSPAILLIGIVFWAILTLVLLWLFLSSWYNIESPGKSLDEELSTLACGLVSGEFCYLMWDPALWAAPERCRVIDVPVFSLSSVMWPVASASRHPEVPAMVGCDLEWKVKSVSPLPLPGVGCFITAPAMEPGHVWLVVSMWPLPCLAV